jgi:uncharacterized protein
MKLQKLNLFFTLFFVALNCSAGQEGDTNKTYLNLSVTETTQVAQDLLSARLTMVSEADNSKDAQNKLNQIMENAVKIAKSVPEVDFATENYYAYQNNPTPDQKNTKTTYKVSQSIVLKSIDAEKILKLSGDLQNMGLLMQGLSYSASGKQIETVTDELISKALAKLQNRANFIAKSLNKSEANLVEINLLSNNYAPPMPLARGVMAATTTTGGTTPPVAEPGKTEVSLTISAKVAM